MGSSRSFPTRKEKKTKGNVYLLNSNKENSPDLIPDMDLNKLVKFHFTFESIRVTNYKRKNKLEKIAEQVLKSTLTFKDGHWEVGLLWKNDKIHLPNNREDALNRLKSLQKRLDKNIEYGDKYCALVDHLLASGYAEKLSEISKNNPRSWYLPHFGVVHPNNLQANIRLVFDGAAKTKATSLNDNLLTGSVWTQPLLEVFIRFRQRNVTAMGDIKEMFLQFKIRKEDRCAQKFLWRGMDRRKESKTYVMKSMIFGSASSPFTAQYVMCKNALGFELTYPIATNAILHNHYVDVYLYSFDVVEERLNCIRDVAFIQNNSGFEIRNWSSNSASLLQEFWIIKVRPTVKKITSRCQKCRSISAKAEQPRMGNLPIEILGHHQRPFVISIILDQCS